MSEPIRNQKWGKVLQVAGGLIGLMGFIALKSRVQNGVVLVLGLLGLVLGAVVFGIGTMLASKKAEDALAADPRAPVVYLRSFDRDRPLFLMRLLKKTVMYGGLYHNMVTSEEAITNSLAAVGPVVAVGKPGEKLPTPGAARAYVDDDDWQALVRDWLERACLVVIQAGNSPGLWWEIESVLARNQPRKTLIHVDFTGRKRRGGWYDHFLTRANEMLPHPLPKRPGQSHFIWFEEDWRPIEIAMKGKDKFHLGERIKGAAKEDLVMQATLAPVIDYLG